MMWIPGLVLLALAVVFVVLFFVPVPREDTFTYTREGESQSFRKKSEPEMRLEQSTLDTESMIEEIIISTSPQENFRSPLQ